MKVATALPEHPHREATVEVYRRAVTRVIAHLKANLGEDHTPESHLIPLVLQVALGQRESVPVLSEKSHDTLHNLRLLRHCIVRPDALFGDSSMLRATRHEVVRFQKHPRTSDRTRRTPAKDSWRRAACGGCRYPTP